MATTSLTALLSNRVPLRNPLVISASVIASVLVAWLCSRAWFSSTSSKSGSGKSVSSAPRSPFVASSKSTKRAVKRSTESEQAPIELSSSEQRLLRHGLDDLESACEALEQLLANLRKLPNSSDSILVVRSSLASAYDALEIMQTRFVIPLPFFGNESVESMSSAAFVSAADSRSVASFVTAKWETGSTILGNTSLDEASNSKYLSSDQGLERIHMPRPASSDDSTSPPIKSPSNGAARAFYLEGRALAEAGKIQTRRIRTDYCACESDLDYLAKLHCLRIAFADALALDNSMTPRPPSTSEGAATQSSLRATAWDLGGKLLAAVVRKTGGSETVFLQAWESTRQWIDEQGAPTMAEELAERGVSDIGFFDVFVDFTVLDALDDLQSPPSAVAAVLGSAWLPSAARKAALEAAVWGVMKSKMASLKIQDGFMTRFYELSNVSTPALAAAAFKLLGEESASVVEFFRSESVTFVRRLFSLDHGGFDSRGSLKESVDIILRETMDKCLARFDC